MAVALDGEPGLVIHTRPYKENSLLLELYTLNYGRISAVARVSKSSASRSRGIYQPYILLKLHLRQSKSNLWQLSEAYMQRVAYQIGVPTLFSATYLNELIYHLVKTHESDPKLFASYINTLELLESGNDEFMALRVFERDLFESLGYAINFETVSGQSIESKSHYFYNPKSGFIVEEKNDSYTYSGQDLINIKNNKIDCQSTKIALKNLNKSIINSLLEGKSLKSRELYAQYMMVK
jgi:DNA repair protein RecO (recombination protein O)